MWREDVRAEPLVNTSKYQWLVAWARWFVMSPGSLDESDASRGESASRGEREGETRGRLCVSSATQLMATVFTFTRTLSCREKATDVGWSIGGGQLCRSDGE